MIAASRRDDVSSCRRSARTAAASAVVAALLLAGLAAPALADPPGPTSWSSEVDAGALPDGLSARVIGGDSFLQVAVDPGRRVDVPGYEPDEAYLRFEADGTVWVNLRSESHWLNQDRYLGEVPPDAGPDAPPQWVQVAADGTWAWHDHRIHWMSPGTLPGEVDPGVAEPQRAYDWTVPLVLDDVPAAVTGSLTWLPPAPPLVSTLAFVAVLAAGVAVARRGRLGAMAAMWGVAVAVTGAVSVAGVVGLPGGVTPEPLPALLAAAAAVVGAVGLVVRGHDRRVVVVGLAGLPLLAWAATNLGAVTAPIVPPVRVPAWLVRAAVGLAAGAGVGLVAMAIRDAFSRPLELAGE